MSSGPHADLKRLRLLERGIIDKHPAHFTVALVYPNGYRVGMSSFGFRIVYGLLNSLPGVRCERAFLTGGRRTRSMESLRLLGDFDCIAFSLSYEPDYFNVVEILRGAGIEALAEKRGERAPLVIAGGVCASLNPEPLADICDLFVLGEAEAVAPELFAEMIRWRPKGKRELLEKVCAVGGVYVPRLFEPHYAPGGRLLRIEEAAAGIPRPARRYAENLDEWPARAPIVTRETEFADRVMVEMMRGCGRQCRFCVADYAYRPPRLRSREKVMEAVEEALREAGGVALLGPSLSDHPDLEEVCTHVVEAGGRLSLSSMRADRLGEGLLELAAAAGLASVTVAPESPAVHLQRKLNKRIPSADIARAAECACKAGLREIKLYYLMGVPGESEADLEAIADEVSEVASCISVRVSLTPLIPKARTPLQWLGMESERALRKKWRHLKKRIEPIGRARLSALSVREAMTEAALARGDRRLTKWILAGRIPPEVRERYATGKRSEDERFPWDHIGAGAEREYLIGEYRRFLRGGITPPCRPGECRACGVCG